MVASRGTHSVLPSSYLQMLQPSGTMVFEIYVFANTTLENAPFALPKYTFPPTP